jgi:hypothetical protein
LYRIVQHKHNSVASVFSKIPLNISFRRSLLGDNLAQRFNLVSKISHVRLNEGANVFRWGFTQNGQFAVKSMYPSLIMGNIWQNRFLWKLKLPLKIKIFLWCLNKGVTLTKDNLARQNWTRSKNCVFCAHEKNIQHLIFDCHYARFLWRAVFFVFGINGPRSVTDMFTTWLRTSGLK